MLNLVTPIQETRAYQSIFAEGEAKGKAEGIAEGEAEVKAEANSLKRQLTGRFGALPAWAQLRIATAPHWQLDLWLDGIFDAESLTALIGAESNCIPRHRASSHARLDHRSGQGRSSHSGRDAGIQATDGTLSAGTDAQNRGRGRNHGRCRRVGDLRASPTTCYSAMTKRPHPPQLNVGCPRFPPDFAQNVPAPRSSAQQSCADARRTRGQDGWHSCPVMKPTTCDTAYFGGIAINICTWSDIRCPSRMRLSFCSANFRNTSPRCRRSCSYNVLRRHFGIKTTWYLHSHLEWLRLSGSSIGILQCCVLGGSQRGVSWMDPRTCQTFAVSPAKPGDFPFY